MKNNALTRIINTLENKVKLNVGLVSDLHLEELPYFMSAKARAYKKRPGFYNSIMNLPPPTKKLDILFFAGDICEFRHEKIWSDFIKQVQSYASLLVFVPGNHEIWKKNFQKIPFYIELIEKQFENVIFLNDTSLKIGNWDIFGTCLWTDFGKKPYIMDGICEKYWYLTDENFNKIKWNNGKLKPAKIKSVSDQSALKVKQWIEQNKEGKKLLLCHYPPLPDPIEYYDNDGKIPSDIAMDLMKIQYRDLSTLLEDNKKIIVSHGHIHAKYSYVAKTGNLVYSNPRGNLDESLEEPIDYRILEFTLN